MVPLNFVTNIQVFLIDITFKLPKPIPDSPRHPPDTLRHNPDMFQTLILMLDNRQKTANGDIPSCDGFMNIFVKISQCSKPTSLTTNP